MIRKLLVVDDERDFVKFLKLNLEEAGYEVAAAYDGEEGLEKVLKEKPDLMILDITLPKMDGYQVLRRFRSEEKYRDYKDMPVIMLTSHHDAKDIMMGMDMGAVSYIAKPFHVSALLGIIDGIIGK
jgi:DNA-binding response OmpR family regulator